MTTHTHTHTWQLGEHCRGEGGSCPYLYAQDTTALKEWRSKQQVLQLPSEELVKVNDIAGIHGNSMEDEGGLSISRVLLILLHHYLIATELTQQST